MTFLETNGIPNGLQNGAQNGIQNGFEAEDTEGISNGVCENGFCDVKPLSHIKKLKEENKGKLNGVCTGDSGPKLEFLQSLATMVMKDGIVDAINREK